MAFVEMDYASGGGSMGLVYEDFPFNQNISAGTIGTRAEVISASVSKSGYKPVSVMVVDIIGSDKAFFTCTLITATDTAMAYPYRTTTSSATVSGKIRVLYIKN